MSRAAELPANRFRQLLTSDMGFILDFIVDNNPVGVADRIADMGLNRPVGPRSMQAALQALLDQGRPSDFVDALSVELHTDNMPDAYATTLLQLAMESGADVVVAGGAPSNRLSRALAMRAMALYDLQPQEEEAPAGAGDDGNGDAPATDDTAAQDAASKRRKIIRTIVWGVVVVGVIVGIAVLVRKLIK